MSHYENKDSNQGNGYHYKQYQQPNLAMKKENG